MALTLMLSVLTILFGVFTLLLGIWIATRCEGNLRWTVIFLVLSIMSVMFHNIGSFLNTSGNAVLSNINIVPDKFSQGPLFLGLTDILSVLFICLAAINIFLLIRKAGKIK